MGTAAPLLAIPFLGAAAFALWWIARGVRDRRALMLAPVVLLLAWGGWWFSLNAVTQARYVCVQCGRMEEQWRFADLVVSRSLRDDGREYARRFAPPEHAHDWHFESCRHRGLGKVECNEQCVEGWFRVLPKLSDRSAAGALLAEATKLPADERCRLMDEVTLCVWFRAEPPETYDAAFERWNAKRGK